MRHALLLALVACVGISFGWAVTYAVESYRAPSEQYFLRLDVQWSQVPVIITDTVHHEFDGACVSVWGAKTPPDNPQRFCGIVHAEKIKELPAREPESKR